MAQSPLVQCPKCHYPNKAGVKFCGSCGLRLPLPDLRCANCGGAIGPENKFCKKCGNPLTQNGQSQARMAYPPDSRPFVPPPPKAGHSRFWMLISGLLVVIALGAVAYLFKPWILKQLGGGKRNFGSGAVVEQVIGPAGGTIRHPDNVIVEVPPGAFEADAKLQVKTISSPTALEQRGDLRGPVVSLSLDPPAKGPFQKAVAVTIPVNGSIEDGLSATFWAGNEWRSIGSQIDAQAHAVTFHTLEFSQYSVMLSRWTDWPEVVIPNPGGEDEFVPKVPRGAVFRLTLQFKGVDPDAVVEGQLRPADTQSKCLVEIAQQADQAAAFGPKGSARITLTGENSEATFLVHVPEEAPLGLHNLYAFVTPGKNPQGSTAWPSLVSNTIEVVNRKVFVLDIDGLRNDVFEELMKKPAGLETLGQIFGRAAGDPVPVTLKPAQLGIGDQEVKTLRFGSGYLVQNATTIFPSYTFAGHAAIFTGKPPGTYGIPGNEWFDRDPLPGNPQRRYAFTGAFLDESIFGRLEFKDAVLGFWHTAFANGVLRSPTVYDRTDELKLGLHNLVGFNMYFGYQTNMTWIYPGLLEQGLEFQASKTGMSFDTSMVSHVLQGAGIDPSFASTRIGPVKRDSRPEKEAFDQMGVVTLYFASVDHSGHAGFDGEQRRDTVTDVHKILLSQHVDGQIGRLWKGLDEVTRRNSLWVIVSDHGQTDMGALVTPDLRKVMLPQEGYFPDSVTLNSPPPIRTMVLPNPQPSRSINDSDTVVAYNGGLAYIYLRRGMDRPWKELPTKYQVMKLAMRVRNWAVQGGPWNGQIDLVLLRLPKGINPDSPGNAEMTDPKGTQYYVLDPADGPNGVIMSVDSYLDREDCVLYDPPPQAKRYHWSKADKAFLSETLQAMNCDRSGDIVILPRYPHFEFESKKCAANHGGIVRSDMNCVLALATPGISTTQSGLLKSLLEESIDLKNKIKPGNRDVPEIVLNYYKSRATFAKDVVANTPVQAVYLPTKDDDTSNTLKITSDALSKLDPDQTRGLMFKLYRASSPNGPFDPVPDDAEGKQFAQLEAYYHWVEDKRQEAGEALPKVTLQDRYRTLKGKQPQRGPFYYKVGQTWIDSNRSVVSKEVFSNIVNPGSGLIRWLESRLSPKEVFTFDGNKCNFSAALSATGQRWDCEDAEFVITKKNWKGHFYSSRHEGERKFGSAFLDYICTGSSADLWIPVVAEGDQSFTVQASGQGMTAVLTETPPLKASVTEAANQALAQANARSESLTAGLRQQLARANAELKSTEDQIRQTPAAYTAEINLRKQQYLQARLKAQLLEQVELACVPAKIFDDNLRNKPVDPTQGVRAYLQELACAQAELQLLQAYHNNFSALLKERLVYRDTSEAQRQALQRDLDYQSKTAAGEQQSYRFKAGAIYRKLSEYALLTGDEKLFRRSCVVLLNYYGGAREKDQGDGTSMTIDMLRRMAHGIAVLTGNREEAGRLWLLADDIELQAAPPYGRQQIEQARKSSYLPAWYPPTNPAKPLAPANLEALMAEGRSGN
jgi:hypothetical protein